MTRRIAGELMAFLLQVSLATIFAVLLFAATSTPLRAADAPTGAEIRVGIDEGDIRGSDNRALQAAVDYIAGLGGGTVRIGPGRYTMRNAVALRDNIHLVGVSGKTILVACPGASSPLAADGDCNQREITLADPAAFHIGDGVSIFDKDSSGGSTSLQQP